MKVPGSNLLRTAMRVIESQTFYYYKFRDRVLNENGQYTIDYLPPITVKGSSQAVSRELFTQLGLEFQKNYRNFFVPQSIFDIQREISGDQFQWCHHIYQCMSKTPWASVDGWDQVLCVQVPPLATS